MTSPLIPTLTGRELTVDVALKQPTILRDRIAKIADSQLLLPKFFHPLGAKVQAGALLYNVVKASDYYTTPVERRQPGTEYKAVEGVEPEMRRAEVLDHGGWFEVSDEQIMRNDVNYVALQTDQLGNTIAKQLDTLAMTAVGDAVTAGDIDTVAFDTNYASLNFVGPDANLTPSGDRPLSHFSAAQLQADLDEMGVKLNLVVCHPEQAHEMRTAYGPDLDAALKSAGLELFSHPQIAEGQMFVVEAGQVGVVGFELALTTEVIDIRERRCKRVQSYVVASFGIDRPHAAKRIVLGP